MSTAKLMGFLSQPILGGLGLLLTVVFGVMSLVFYIRQRQQKDLCYRVKDGFTHLYARSYEEGRDAQQNFEKFEEGLGLSTKLEERRGQIVTIWNRGKATIESTAVSTADPLLITADANTFIRYAYVAKQKKKANGARVEISTDYHSARVYFDFLDWQDGFEIGLDSLKVASDKPLKVQPWVGTLLRSAKRTSDFKLTGTIMGVREIKRLHEIPHWEEVSAFSIIGFLIVSAFIGIAFSISQLSGILIIASFDGRYGAPLEALVFGIITLWFLALAWHYRSLPKGRAYWEKSTRV